MTHTATAPVTTPAIAPSGLRSLYLIRIAFSVIWVTLVFATSASLKSKDTPTTTAAALLVVYPLWDAIATFLERRMAGTGTTSRVSAVNMALGVAAAIAMIAAVFSTIGAALLVFGIWALAAGAIQLSVALRRWRAVGAQWPMVISGGLSVLAGASFAVMSLAAKSDLSTIAGYSAFGAFWFLVSVVALSLRRSRTGNE
jgi:uncharacterized membrane protein HdeD (DUF308 family)